MDEVYVVVAQGKDRVTAAAFSTKEKAMAYRNGLKAWGGYELFIRNCVIDSHDVEDKEVRQ